MLRLSLRKYSVGSNSAQNEKHNLDTPFFRLSSLMCHLEHLTHAATQWMLLIPEVYGPTECSLPDTASLLCSPLPHME